MSSLPLVSRLIEVIGDANRAAPALKSSVGDSVVAQQKAEAADNALSI
jgi:hypothetical protein